MKEENKEARKAYEKWRDKIAEDIANEIMFPFKIALIAIVVLFSLWTIIVFNLFDIF